MLLRGVAIETIATDFSYDILKICCHGYHSNTPEQYKVNSYYQVFLGVSSCIVLVKSPSYMSPPLCCNYYIC